MMLASGGKSTETEEVFNDSLVLLIEKIQQPDFKLTSQLSTYLFGINRFLWKNKLRNNQNSAELEWSDTLILTAEDLGYSQEKEDKLQQLEAALKLITKRCQEILKRFYFESQSMKEIATAMSFSSINSAKTQKYKCIESAIGKVKSNPQTQQS